MKSIKIHIFPFVLVMLFSTALSSQNDFYDSKKEMNTVNLNLSKTDSILVFDYHTEKDYNNLHNKEATKPKYIEEEIYSDENPNGNEKMQITAEDVVEIVVHTLLIVATFWY